MNSPDFQNVYLVSGSQAIDWIKTPTPVSRISSFQPWQCNSSRPVCDEKAALTCWYDHNRKLVKPPEGGVFKMHWCSIQCTPCYPTLNDPTGQNC